MHEQDRHRSLWDARQETHPTLPSFQSSRPPRSCAQPERREHQVGHPAGSPPRAPATPFRATERAVDERLLPVAGALHHLVAHAPSARRISRPGVARWRAAPGEGAVRSLAVVGDRAGLGGECDQRVGPRRLDAGEAAAIERVATVRFIVRTNGLSRQASRMTSRSRRAGSSDLQNAVERDAPRPRRRGRVRASHRPGSGS